MLNIKTIPQGYLEKMKMNKSWLHTGLILGALFLLFSCAGVRPSSGPVIVTTSGAVRGYADEEQTWSWKGIPYAKPPSGSLRWKAPLPPDPWPGILEARNFAPPCVQRLFAGGPVIGSEDCLYLNIWKPRHHEEPLPVYVFIHGGGNTFGSSSIYPDYHGSRLAQAGEMIFVSMNYRLGPFGWFLHPSLTEDSGNSAEDSSGNYGLLDILRCLEWIQENIAAFGGDPGNVTLAGQSAGGMNVLALLLSERASGLFHRAVCQSGALMTSTPEEGYQRGIEVFHALLVAEGAAKTEEEAARLSSQMTPAERAQYLRAKKPEELLSLYQVVPSGLTDFPFHFTDGHVLPEEGFEALERGTYPNTVPLMIGSNRDEFTMFFPAGSLSENRSSRFRYAVSLGSTLWKADAVDAVARKLTERPDQGPVYAYYFLWGSSHRGEDNVLPGEWSILLGASHSLEVPFFFGSQEIPRESLARPLFTRANRKGRMDLSREMMLYLSNFVYTGNPNTPEEPSTPWLPWSNQQGDEKCIIFDAGEKNSHIHMSYQELHGDTLLDLYGRYMPPEDFNRVMEAVFWR
ncbi:MAG: carboxylesterase family protein [Spirochaetales bacterium]|nr:carboxylesterase family protein [Spirochaetales bacterium]